HLEFLAHDLDFTAADVRIHRAIGPPAHEPDDLDAELVAHALRARKHFGSVRIADDLRKSFPIAQDDEDHAAMIAAAMHPAVQRHGLAQLRDRNLARITTPHHDLRFGPDGVDAGPITARSGVAATSPPAGPSAPRSSGATTPIDTTYLSASSTL